MACIPPFITCLSGLCISACNISNLLHYIVNRCLALFLCAFNLLYRASTACGLLLLLILVWFDIP